MLQLLLLPVPRILRDAGYVCDIMNAVYACATKILLCLTVWVALGASDSPCVEDIPSRTARADIVIDGRVRSRHSNPVWYNSGTPAPAQTYFNVTVRPRRVLKGWLQRGHDASGYIPVVVGPFALEEDGVNCVPSVAVGGRYIMFMRGNGSAASVARVTAQQTTLFFQLSGFPAAYTGETASLARQYSCTGCSK